jgi:hypothetical protein
MRIMPKKKEHLFEQSKVEKVENAVMEYKSRTYVGL